MNSATAANNEAVNDLEMAVRYILLAADAGHSKA
jgi:hypothetical protein